MSAGGLLLSMKPDARYLKRVPPGLVSGVALVTADKIENFHPTANDDFPEPDQAVAPTGTPSRPWGRVTRRR